MNKSAQSCFCNFSFWFSTLYLCGVYKHKLQLVILFASNVVYLQINLFIYLRTHLHYFALENLFIIKINLCHFLRYDNDHSTLVFSTGRMLAGSCIFIFIPSSNADRMLVSNSIYECSPLSFIIFKIIVLLFFS